MRNKVAKDVDLPKLTSCPLSSVLCSTTACHIVDQGKVSFTLDLQSTYMIYLRKASLSNHLRKISSCATRFISVIPCLECNLNVQGMSNIKLTDVIHFCMHMDTVRLIQLPVGSNIVNVPCIVDPG